MTEFKLPRIIRTERSAPPDPPTGYEQGNRDGLLTARSALLATRDIDVALRTLDQLIDSKQQDLWNTLAIFQVSSPEAASLRHQLRGPFGVGVDAEGRVLFLRIPNSKNPMAPIEYDTGVMGLLKRANELESQLKRTERDLTA